MWHTRSLCFTSEKGSGAVKAEHGEKLIPILNTLSVSLRLQLSLQCLPFNWPLTPRPALSMVINAEGQLERNNSFNASSYLSTASYKCNRIFSQKRHWVYWWCALFPVSCTWQENRNNMWFWFAFFSLTSVVSRGRNETYEIPRASSALCRLIVNPKWEILTLWFWAGHLYTAEISGTKLELMKSSSLKSPSPAQAEDCCASLQTARACSSPQDMAHSCLCIPALCNELV